MACGEQVILEIDVQGAFQVRDKMPVGPSRVHRAAVACRCSRSACADAEPRRDEVIATRMEAAGWSFRVKWSMICGW